MDTYHWEQKNLGEHIEYPGHPLILACMIMDKYPSFDEASAKPAGQDFYNAISDSFIPGAGDAVSTSMSVLRHALEGDLDLAYQLADHYWECWEAQSPGNAKRGLHGRNQAERIKPGFEQRLVEYPKLTRKAAPAI